MDGNVKRPAGQAAHGIAGSGLPPEWKADVEWRGWMVEANLGDHEGAAAWADASAATCDAAAALAARRARAVRRPGHASGIEHLMMTEVVPALVAAGEDEVATQLLREVGRSVRRSGVPLAANHLFTMVAIVDHLQGRHERAGRLLAAARYLGGAADLPIPFRTPGTMSFYRHYLPLVRSALGSDEARRARAEGRAMTVDEALVYALEGLGEGHRETSSLAVAPVR